MTAKNTRDAQIADAISERVDEERQAIKNTKNRNASNNIARETIYLQEFEAIAKRVFKNVIIVPFVAKKSREPKSRILNVLLSDLHFGSQLDHREVPIQYGPVESARRLAAIVVGAADYKRQYRQDTECYVHILGDIIQGNLHDPRDGSPLAAQQNEALFLLVQAIGYLASQFSSVKVFCTPGNHGRNTARHPKRATMQKWDSHETFIYYALKIALMGVPSVGVEVQTKAVKDVTIPYTPYYSAKMFERYGFFTHGDTVLQPGYPGKAIDVASIQKQVNTWNSSTKLGIKHDLFCVGHVHTGALVHLPNGVTFISNGALIPTDPFGISIGLPESSCGQWIWESVEKNIVGDSRFLYVDESIDRDASYDRIIKPFTEM